MKKILITGHLGLLGSSCVDLFHARGWDVVGIDNNSRAAFFDTKEQTVTDKSTNYVVDLRNFESVEEIFKKHRFDAIIHCAGQPSHDWATDHVLEDFEINAWGTVFLLEMTREYCPDATFVYVSTDKVYGENMEGEKLSDESLGLDSAGDRSFFGCSKAAADMYAQQYAARFGMKVGIFRPGCITGKNHQGAAQHGFLAYLAKTIKEGKTYTIYGNGKQVRDQIHANDLAAAFSAFVDSPRSGAVYNMGGGPDRSVSVLEAISLFEKETGKKAEIVHAEARKGDRIYDTHDVSKFRKEYPNWEYKYSLQDIIEELCQI